MDQLGEGEEMEAFPLPPGALLGERIRTAPAGSLIELAPGDYEGPFSFDRAVTLRGVGNVRLFSKRGTIVRSQASGCVFENVHLEGNGDVPVVEADPACEVVLRDCFLKGNAGSVRTIGSGWRLPDEVQLTLDESGDGRTFVEIQTPVASSLRLTGSLGEVEPSEIGPGGSTVGIIIRNCLLDSGATRLEIKTGDALRTIPVRMRRRELAVPTTAPTTSHHAYPVPLELLPSGRKDVGKLAQELSIPLETRDEVDILREILGSSRLKTLIRRREDRHNRWTVDFAIDPDTLDPRFGRGLRKHCLFLSINISTPAEQANGGQCWLVKKGKSGLLIPDGASRAWEGSFDCGSFGSLDHGLLAAIRSIEPPPADLNLQFDAWNAFLAVEMAEAEASQFYVFGTHAYAGGGRLNVRIDPESACVGERRLAPPDFWARCRAAAGQELAYSPDTLVDSDSVFGLGILDSVDVNRRVASIRLSEENVERLDDGSLEFPRSLWIAYQANGDVSQVRRKQYGLQQLERGVTKNSRLGLFFFDAQSARCPGDVPRLSEPEMLLGAKVNADQKIAVEKALAAPDLMLIQGPPGTGKTTVIAELCYQLAKEGKRCLVASQTNLAVDNALSRLEHHPAVRAIRAGNASRLEEEGKRFSEAEVVRTWLGNTAAEGKRRLSESRRRIRLVEVLIASEPILDELSAARATTMRIEGELQGKLQALVEGAEKAEARCESAKLRLVALSAAMRKIDDRQVPDADDAIPVPAVDWSADSPYASALSFVLSRRGSARPDDVFGFLGEGAAALQWIENLKVETDGQHPVDDLSKLAQDTFAQLVELDSQLEALRSERVGAQEARTRLLGDRMLPEDWNEAESLLPNDVRELARELRALGLLKVSAVPGLLELASSSNHLIDALKVEENALREIGRLSNAAASARSELKVAQLAVQSASKLERSVELLEQERHAVISEIGSFRTTRNGLAQAQSAAEDGFAALLTYIGSWFAVAHDEANPSREASLVRSKVEDFRLEDALEHAERHVAKTVRDHATERQRGGALRNDIRRHAEASRLMGFNVDVEQHRSPTFQEAEKGVAELAAYLREWQDKGYRSGFRRVIARQDVERLRGSIVRSLRVCAAYVARPERPLSEEVERSTAEVIQLRNSAFAESRRRLNEADIGIDRSRERLRGIESNLEQLGPVSDIDTLKERESLVGERVHNLQKALAVQRGRLRWNAPNETLNVEAVTRGLKDVSARLEVLRGLPAFSALQSAKETCERAFLEDKDARIASAELEEARCRSLRSQALRQLHSGRQSAQAGLRESLLDPTPWNTWRDLLSQERSMLLDQQAAAERKIAESTDRIGSVNGEIETLRQGRAGLEERWERLCATIPVEILSAAPEGAVDDPAVLRSFIPQIRIELDRHYRVATREEDLLEKWTGRLDALTDEEEQELRHLYVSNANVVGITCVQAGAVWFKAKYGHFDVVIVDEVSKATPPELLLPSLMGDKIVLIGDTMQLPPLIGQETFKEVATRLGKSKAELGFVEQSLFKELWSQLPEDDSRKHRLTTQYRMHPQICQAIQQFYDHKLSDGPDVRMKLHGMDQSPFTSERHFLWIDMPKSEAFFESREGLSFVNHAELRAIRDVLTRMNECLSEDDVKDVGVITFYGAQLRMIRKLVDEIQPELSRLRIRTGTVDRFQGMEREIVLVSLVRNNAGRSVGFAERPERLNVALSRAKELLVVIGSQNHFSQALECGAMYAEVAGIARMHGGIIGGEGYSA